MVKTIETQLLVLNLLLVLYQFVSVNSCPLNEFKCNSSAVCIEISKRCNIDFDCADYSDELDCPVREFCPEAQFRCKNGLCVASDAKCNGIVQCPDESDENQCGGAYLNKTSSHSYTLTLTPVLSNSYTLTSVLTHSDSYTIAVVHTSLNSYPLTT